MRIRRKTTYSIRKMNWIKFLILGIDLKNLIWSYLINELFEKELILIVRTFRQNSGGSIWQKKVNQLLNILIYQNKRIKLNILNMLKKIAQQFFTGISMSHRIEKLVFSWEILELWDIKIDSNGWQNEVNEQTGGKEWMWFKIWLDSKFMTRESFWKEWIRKIAPSIWRIEFGIDEICSSFRYWSVL
jgi:hypothetical protein